MPLALALPAVTHAPGPRWSALGVGQELNPHTPAAQCHPLLFTLPTSLLEHLARHYLCDRSMVSLCSTSTSAMRHCRAHSYERKSVHPIESAEKDEAAKVTRTIKLMQPQTPPMIGVPVRVMIHANPHSSEVVVNPTHSLLRLADSGQFPPSLRHLACEVPMVESAVALLPDMITSLALDDVHCASSTSCASVCFPSSLRSLDLRAIRVQHRVGRRSTLELCPHNTLVLPSTLTSLRLPDWCQTPLTGIVWPPSLTRLRCGQQRPDSIPIDQLTHLTTLSIVGNPTAFAKLPPNLTTLSMDDPTSSLDTIAKSWSRHPTLRSIEFVGRCRPIENLTFPPGLTQLHFARRRWGNGVPTSMTHPIERIQLPSTLVSLILPPDFNRPVKDIQLPSSLTRLHFGFRSISIDHCPFSNLFNQSLPSHLPSSLTDLFLGNSKWVGGEPDFVTNWPDSLDSLELPPYFDGSLNQLRLPSRLRRLSLGPPHLGPIASDDRDIFYAQVAQTSTSGQFFAKSFNPWNAVRPDECQPVERVAPGFERRMIQRMQTSRSLLNILWPDHLSEITIGDATLNPRAPSPAFFGHPPVVPQVALELVAWPSSLHTLRVHLQRHKFLRLWTPPPNLTHLMSTVETEGFHIADIRFPPRLACLELHVLLAGQAIMPTSWTGPSTSTHPIDWPLTLSKLILVGDMNSPILDGVLPSSLRELAFAIVNINPSTAYHHPRSWCSWSHSLRRYLVLPSGLTALTMPHEFDQPIEDLLEILPTNLRALTIYANVTRFRPDPSLPGRADSNSHGSNPSYGVPVSSHLHLPPHLESLTLPINAYHLSPESHRFWSSLLTDTPSCSLTLVPNQPKPNMRKYPFNDWESRLPAPY